MKNKKGHFANKIPVVFENLNSFHPHVTLRNPITISHRRHLPYHMRRRRDESDANAGGFVPTDKNSRRGRGHLFQRDASRTD
jgi:hypothetical protein